MTTNQNNEAVHCVKCGRFTNTYCDCCGIGLCEQCTVGCECGNYCCYYCLESLENGNHKCVDCLEIEELTEEELTED